ncbi:MAG TPA: serine/threonine-protein kinase [Bryobacteraceae bacterium]|nr:serine/threonine-protein kinase [Bryobacteraceae bacterium]
MTAERWNRVKDVYSRALELPEEQRDSFVAAACAADLELRQEVESLLESEKKAGQFLESPVLGRTTEDTGTSPPVAPPFPQRGDRLGIYSIVQQVGEGGMGAVYQAIRDDDAFRKLVAVKILKRGMDTDYLVQRFENEKQILAHFDHPNIARLLDAGVTPDSRPYFVMEFYSGLPLDRYCREKRPTLEARIRLFQKICAAVEYAHENLIVHRDLKPGNILITEDGEPHLLDFGIAKLLSDERQVTVAGLRIMTPGYASPEQIRGEPVNTSTDIYSLGVLLYEVLTDSHPFPQRNREPFSPASLDLDKDPKPPSTLIRTTAAKSEALPESITSVREWSHRLRGDLDKIVLKALAADPWRRYRTVEQLAADLDRFLAGQPVAAAGDSVTYYVKKFVGRNRLAVGSAAVFIVALAVALGIAIHEAAKARREQALAEGHATQLRRLAESLVFDIHDAIETLPGATPVREKLLSRATEALDSLVSAGAGDVAGQVELADAYTRLGAVQGSPSESNLGRTEEALREYRKAAGLLEHLAVSKNTPDVLKPLADVYDHMARVLNTLGRGKESLDVYWKSIHIREQLFARDPSSLDARRSLAVARFSAARIQIDAGNLKEAERLAQDSLKEYEAVLAADPSHAQTRFGLALNAKTLAAIEAELKDYEAANRYASRALEIDMARLKGDPQNANIPLDISFDLSEIADADEGRHDMESARLHCQQALEMRETLLSKDPTNERLRDRTAFMNGRLGLLLLGMSRTAEAKPYIRREYDLLERLAADTTNATTKMRFASARGDLGDWYCRAGDKARGRSLLSAAISEFKEVQRSKSMVFAETLPLERLEKAAAACDTQPDLHP